MSLATTQTISRTDLRAYAFTRDSVFSGTRDHVFSHSPTTAIFLDQSLGDFGGVRLRGSGHSVHTAGGNMLQIRVRLGKHSGSKWMTGPWDTHSVTPDDNTRLGEANWMHASGALVISEYDKSINVGDAAMGSFVADQTESVMLALVDTIGDAIHDTSSGANQITSLDSLISANDTVQNLSGASYDNFNSRGVSARGTAAGSVSFASGGFSAQGISDMRTLYNNASEGMIQPNVILTEYATHERYEAVLQPLERFQGAVRTADASFGALAFRTTPVLADPKVASGYLYMLRVGSDGVEIKVLSPHDFRFAPFKPGSNQETFVSELQWKGQLVIHNRRYGCNKMTGITD